MRINGVASFGMLVFLYVAGRQGFRVAAYHDEATGEMAKNERGVPWVSAVTLHPVVTYTGDKRPTPEQEARLHEVSHEQCYIANSVKTTVTVAPSPAAS